MEGLLIFIKERLPFLVDHIYLFLFVGGAVEGFNSLVLAGFLASFEGVKLIIIFPILVFAHMINGYIWYFVGYFGGAKSLDKWGHKKEISHNIINKINEYFQKYSGRAIMFAKMTFSLDIATMILSGSLKYDFKKFTKYNFYGSTGWVAMTFFIGYFFGQSFKLFFEVIVNLTIAMAFLAGAIALMYSISLILKRYYINYLILRGKLKDWRSRFSDGITRFLNGDGGGK